MAGILNPSSPSMQHVLYYSRLTDENLPRVTVATGQQAS
jgi:hypothetical protein